MKVFEGHVKDGLDAALRPDAGHCARAPGDRERPEMVTHAETKAQASAYESPAAPRTFAALTLGHKARVDKLGPLAQDPS